MTTFICLPFAFMESRLKSNKFAIENAHTPIENKKKFGSAISYTCVRTFKSFLIHDKNTQTELRIVRYK